MTGTSDGSLYVVVADTLKNARHIHREYLKRKEAEEKIAWKGATGGGEERKNNYLLRSRRWIHGISTGKSDAEQNKQRMLEAADLLVRNGMMVLTTREYHAALGRATTHAYKVKQPLKPANMVVAEGKVAEAYKRLCGEKKQAEIDRARAQVEKSQAQAELIDAERAHKTAERNIQIAEIAVRRANANTKGVREQLVANQNLIRAKLEELNASEAIDRAKEKTAQANRKEVDAKSRVESVTLEWEAAKERLLAEKGLVEVNMLEQRGDEPQMKKKEEPPKGLSKKQLAALALAEKNIRQAEADQAKLLAEAEKLREEQKLQALRKECAELELERAKTDHDRARQQAIVSEIDLKLMSIRQTAGMALDAEIDDALLKEDAAKAALQTTLKAKEEASKKLTEANDKLDQLGAEIDRLQKLINPPKEEPTEGTNSAAA
jgi:hypothetical protein